MVLTGKHFFASACCFYLFSHKYAYPALLPKIGTSPEDYRARKGREV